MSSYPLPLGLGFRAVPVFPATQKSGISAFVPVPARTPYVSILVSIAAVCSEITRWVSDAGVDRSVPSGPTMPSTSFGATHTPPLATVA